MTLILIPKLLYHRRSRSRCPSPSGPSTYHIHNKLPQKLHRSFNERVRARVRRRSISTRHPVYPAHPDPPRTLRNSVNN